MTIKKGKTKKSDFSLTPIVLSEPIKRTDGFSNLVDAPEISSNLESVKSEDMSVSQKLNRKELYLETIDLQRNTADVQNNDELSPKISDVIENTEEIEVSKSSGLSEAELLRILDAESFDEIYELSDVLRASSLKLYTTLVRLADSRGRLRVKNHELMSKAGIKGIATLYKQERWLIDLKLLEKKAKPGPHDGSSYVVNKLETLPLPHEIYEKFDKFLQDSGDI